MRRPPTVAELYEAYRSSRRRGLGGRRQPEVVRAEAPLDVEPAMSSAEKALVLDPESTLAKREAAKLDARHEALAEGPLNGGRR